MPCDHNQNDEFHDCYLLGVYSENIKEKIAELTIECYSCGANIKVVLEGLDRLHVEDFWEGNIIYDLKQYEWPNIPPDLLARVFHLSSSERLHPSDPDLDRLLDNQMILIHITPSYGCELLALCKAIRVLIP